MVDLPWVTVPVANSFSRPGMWWYWSGVGWDLGSLGLKKEDPGGEKRPSNSWVNRRTGWRRHQLKVVGRVQPQNLFTMIWIRSCLFRLLYKAGLRKLIFDWIFIFHVGRMDEWIIDWWISKLIRVYFWWLWYAFILNG